jgi:hypothetical protein
MNADALSIIWCLAEKIAADAPPDIDLRVANVVNDSQR